MVGVLARFEFHAGHEEEVGRFFAEGRVIVEGQPASTGWYAARVGPSTYAAFAVFATEADRDALLAAGGPVLSRTYGHLFAAPPTFDKVDIIEHRAPAPVAGSTGA
jgi:hypothetical protein